MHRILNFAAAFVTIVAGCTEPELPREAQTPPELTAERAKEALIEMLRDNPKALQGGPAYPAEKLAGEKVTMKSSELCDIGAFTVDLRRTTWHIESRGPGCMWLIDGKFEVAGARWAAKPTHCSIAHPGPIGPLE